MSLFTGVYRNQKGRQLNNCGLIILRIRHCVKQTFDRCTAQDTQWHAVTRGADSDVVWMSGSWQYSLTEFNGMLSCHSRWSNGSRIRVHHEWAPGAALMFLKTHSPSILASRTFMEPDTKIDTTCSYTNGIVQGVRSWGRGCGWGVGWFDQEVRGGVLLGSGSQWHLTSLKSVSCPQETGSHLHFCSRAGCQPWRLSSHLYLVSAYLQQCVCVCVSISLCTESRAVLWTDRRSIACILIPLFIFKPIQSLGQSVRFRTLPIQFIHHVLNVERKNTVVKVFHCFSFHRLSPLRVGCRLTFTLAWMMYGTL